MILLSCREPKTLLVITWWQRDHMCVYSDLQQYNGCVSSELLTVYLWCYIPEWPQQDVLTKTLSLVNSEQFKQANLQQTHVHDTSYRRTQYKYKFCRTLTMIWWVLYNSSLFISANRYCDSCLLWLYLIEPRMKVVVTMTSLRLVLL